MPEPSEDLVVGAIDLYVHANPDLFPRRTNDIALAQESAAAGLTAVLHRHHHSPTAERSKIAAEATGFPILGAVLLNDSVGGINPSAVDLAIQMGAVWVGLPTTSAMAFRTRTRDVALHFPIYAPGLTFGPGKLTATDTDGNLLPETEDVLRLVADANVALNLGYVSSTEQLAVARAASDLGHAKLVITNSELSDAELTQAMAIPGLYFEITTYVIHPEGLGAGHSEGGIEQNVALVRRVGVDRVVLSSDGGMQGSPPPAEILRWAFATYERAGLTQDELRVMTHDNPRRLVSLAGA